MHVLLARPLEVHTSKGDVEVIEAGDLYHFTDLVARDYVTIKFKYQGKSYWCFRDALLHSIHGEHGKDIASTVAFPGFTIYLFNERKTALVIRVAEDMLVLEDLTQIPVDSLDYGVLKRKVIELPNDKQFVLKNNVHAYHKTRIVTESELDKFQKYLDDFDTIAFDTETTGLLQDMYKLEDREDFLVSISLSVDANSGFYVRATKTDRFREFIEYLSNKHLLIHNAAFDIGVLSGVYGLEPKRFDDTLIMAKLLNENLMTYRLKDLSTQILGRGKQLKLNEFDYLGYLGAGYFDKIEYILAYYAAGDTANTFGLYQYTVHKIQADSALSDYYRDVELASIIPVSVAISQNGLKVDKEALAQLEVESRAYIDELLLDMQTITAPYIKAINEQYIKEQCVIRGMYTTEVVTDFRLRGLITNDLEEQVTREMISNVQYNALPPYASCKKLATYHNRLAAKPTGYIEYTLDMGNKKFMELLAYTSPHGFRLPPQKSKTGNYSLNKAAISEIEKYLHEKVTSGELRYQQVQKFFECFKEYTKTRKLLDAFITPTLNTIGDYVDGKLHASYNLLGTVSSRASCNNPNF